MKISKELFFKSVKVEVGPYGNNSFRCGFLKTYTNFTCKECPYERKCKVTGHLQMDLFLSHQKEKIRILKHKKINEILK